VAILDSSPVRCQVGAMPDLAESVMDFVAEYTGAERIKLTPASTLFGDLGVDGDDGWQLMEEFGQKFEVDLSGFEGGRHFGPEGCFPPLMLWNWIRLALKPSGMSHEERSGLKPIRISDLIAAAREKRWTL
jgi:hypothetical protein